MHQAGIQGSRAEIVGGRHCMDIAGQVQVKIFHGHKLGVAAACRSTLNAEGGAL